jgi:TIR domain
MPEAEGGGIFVSYRQQESAHLAGRLYDRLADRLGEGQVFIDVDAIKLAVDFAEEISRAVAACQVLLAVIGTDWLVLTRQDMHLVADALADQAQRLNSPAKWGKINAQVAD